MSMKKTGTTTSPPASTPKNCAMNCWRASRREIAALQIGQEIAGVATAPG